MSAINDFLIKSAGLEKEANKVFQKLLKRGIDPFNLVNKTTGQRIDVHNRKNVAFRDLTTPLKDRKSLSYLSLPSINTAKFDLVGEYANYLNRVAQNSKDPRIIDYLKYKRKRNELDRFASRGSTQASDALSHIRSLLPYGTKLPALLRKYKVRTPYATTRHLAKPDASLHANAGALETPSDVTYVWYTDPGQGVKDWRSAHFRANRPGQRWTEDEMKQMLTSDDLDGTPLFETVFTRGTKEFPAPIATYVADTPEIRKMLDIPESAKSIPIADVQDPTMDFVYKGTPGHLAGLTSERLYNDLLDGLRDTAPEQYRKNGVVDAVLARRMGDLGTLQQAVGLSPHRWFTPAAKIGAGYMGNVAKNVIRLDANALAMYRKLVANNQDTFDAMIRNAVGELPESQRSDLIRVALRDSRINKLRKAYEDRVASTGLQEPVRNVLSFLVDQGL